MLTGSGGAREATVIHEWMVADLADLEKCWSALGKIDTHKKWSKDMEPCVRLRPLGDFSVNGSIANRSPLVRRAIPR